MEVEKAQHELELQDTTLRQDIEALKQHLAQMEQETQLALQNQKQAHDQDLGCLKQEKVSAAALKQRQRGAWLGWKLRLDQFRPEMRHTCNSEGSVQLGTSLRARSPR